MEAKVTVVVTDGDVIFQGVTKSVTGQGARIGSHPSGEVAVVLPGITIRKLQDKRFHFDLDLVRDAVGTISALFLGVQFKAPSESRSEVNERDHTLKVKGSFGSDAVEIVGWRKDGGSGGAITVKGAVQCSEGKSKVLKEGGGTTLRLSLRKLNLKIRVPTSSAGKGVTFQQMLAAKLRRDQALLAAKMAEDFAGKRASHVAHVRATFRWRPPKNSALAGEVSAVSAQPLMDSSSELSKPPRLRHGGNSLVPETVCVHGSRNMVVLLDTAQSKNAFPIRAVLLKCPGSLEDGVKLMSFETTLSQGRDLTFFLPRLDLSLESKYAIRLTRGGHGLCGDAMPLNVMLCGRKSGGECVCKEVEGSVKEDLSPLPSSGYSSSVGSESPDGDVSDPQPQPGPSRITSRTATAQRPAEPSVSPREDAYKSQAAAAGSTPTAAPESAATTVTASTRAAASSSWTTALSYGNVSGSHYAPTAAPSSSQHLEQHILLPASDSAGGGQNLPCGWQPPTPSYGFLNEMNASSFDMGTPHGATQDGFNASFSGVRCQIARTDQVAGTQSQGSRQDVDNDPLSREEMQMVANLSANPTLSEVVDIEILCRQLLEEVPMDVTEHQDIQSDGGRRRAQMSEEELEQDGGGDQLQELEPFDNPLSGWDGESIDTDGSDDEGEEEESEEEDEDEEDGEEEGEAGTVLDGIAQLTLEDEDGDEDQGDAKVYSQVDSSSSKKEGMINPARCCIM